MSAASTDAGKESAASSSAAASEVPTEVAVPALSTKEQLMLKLGKDLRRAKDFAYASHTLAHLLESSVKERGDEMNINLAPIYHEYGITLLAKARASSSIFGGAEEEARQPATASDAALTDAAEEQGQDLVEAHDILDVARAVYEANSKGDSEAAKKNAFRLAQCREDLADCMMESDRMGDAFDELQRALELHVGLKSPARAQAETLQQMVLCLSYIQSEVGKGQGATAGGYASSSGKLAPELVVLGRALKVQRFAVHALAYAALDICSNVESLGPLAPTIQGWIEQAEACGAAEAPDVGLPQKEQTARSMVVLTEVTEAVKAKRGTGTGATSSSSSSSSSSASAAAPSAGLGCPMLLDRVRAEAESKGISLDGEDGDDLTMMLETLDASLQRYEELAGALEPGDSGSGGQATSGGDVDMGAGFQFFGGAGGQGAATGAASGAGESTTGFGGTGGADAGAGGAGVVVHEVQVRRKKKKKKPAKRVAPTPIEEQEGYPDQKAARVEGKGEGGSGGDEGAVEGAGSIAFS